MRGQTSLPALGLALLVLTGVTVLGVAVADGALRAADRSPTERQAAVTLSDRLVGPQSPLTARANVVNESAVAALNGSSLRTRYGVPNGTDARVTLEGKTVASTGDVGNGVTIARLVVVQQRQRRTLTPAFAGSRSVTLPRRTDRVDVRISPPSNTTVRTVRNGNRVVLHDDGGLSGSYTVSVSQYRTATLEFQATGPLYRGNVSVGYYPVETRKARLEVTVDG